MIVVDSSAIVAYLQDEPEAAEFRDILYSAGRILMSAVNVFECRMVLNGRLGDAAVARFDALAAEVGIEIVPFDQDQSRLAFEAHRRFGRGSGHAARLNMGDCAAYALAASRGLPLLFKGGDFAATDVRRP
ncbi:MAG TPA: type II toxin-antitoxin system VapC family toxin [Azospirillaceae bacterium]|nr:type II toxin-antitoxin system VapC family toxin [Azospirillaceae bacterium]